MVAEQEVTSRNAARLALKAAEQVEMLAKLRRLAEMHFYDEAAAGQLAKRMMAILDGLDA